MKRSELTVTAVIVNWNGISDTRICLQSLARVNRKGVRFTVTVVDNGSVDDSVTVIRKLFPSVDVIETGENLGFTGGNNVGIAQAMKKGADIVWLLNNDTYVDPNVLSFTRLFDDPAVGAVGSKIYFAKGHEFHYDRYTDKQRGNVIWYAGGLVDWKNMYASHRGVDEVDSGQYDSVEDTPFITGCSFAARSDTLKQTGVLDDTYYLYLEDLDLSLRIQNAGYRTLYDPKSVVWHVNAGSSGKPGNPVHEYYITRNRIFVAMRYASFRTKVAIVRESLRFLAGKSPVRRRAVLDAFLGRDGKQYVPKKSA